MKKIFSAMAVILSLLLLISGTQVSAQTEKTGQLLVGCQSEDVLLSGMQWDLYKVASIDHSSNSFDLIGDFAQYPVKINNLTTSQLISAAETLEAYAFVDEIPPLKSLVTDSDGNADFENLEYGVYLLSGTPVTINDKYYLPTPSIVVLDEDSELSSNVKWNYNVNAMPKLKVLSANDKIYKFNGTVKAVWEKDRQSDRPESIKAVLYKDGQIFKTAELNAADNWSYTWGNLSSKYKWTVIEEDVPDKYTVTYTQKAVNINPDDANEHDMEFLITNTGDYVETKPVQTTMPPKPQPLPQTGQLWWPVPLCSASGMIIFAAGWKINSVKRKKR